MPAGGGVPRRQQPGTPPGQLPDLAFSPPGFAGLAAAMVVLAYAFARRRAPGWAIYSGLSGAAFLVLFLLAVAGFGQDPRWVGTAACCNASASAGSGSACSPRRMGADRAAREDP